MQENLVNAALGVYSMAILLMLLFLLRQNGTVRTPRNKWLIRILLYQFFLECAAMMHNQFLIPNRLYWELGFFFHYLLDPGLVLMWMLYMHQWVDGGGKRERYWFVMPVAAVALNTVLICLNPVMHLYYQVDGDGLFRRTSLFQQRTIVMIFFVFYYEVYILRWKNKINPKAIIWLMLFPIIPLLGGVIQISFSGMPDLEITGEAAAMLLMYLSLQELDSKSDFLTGAGNRQMLDSTLEFRVATADRFHNFSCMYVDMDRFKEINDTYGHETGDMALKTAVTIMTHTIGKKGTVYRYGGDEFVIIMDISDGAVLDQMANRIRDNMQAFNETGKQPFCLSVSCGCKVYDLHMKPASREFLKTVDELMYEEKKKKHAMRE